MRIIPIAVILDQWPVSADRVQVPSRRVCPVCNGAKGWHDGARSMGYEAPWGWHLCNTCEGTGELYSAACKAVRRYSIRLYQEVAA